MLIDYIRFLGFSTVKEMHERCIRPDPNSTPYVSKSGNEQSVVLFERFNNWIDNSHSIQRVMKWTQFYMTLPVGSTPEDRISQGLLTRWSIDAFEHEVQIPRMNLTLLPKLEKILHTYRGRFHTHIAGEIYGGIRPSLFVPFVDNDKGKCVISFEDPKEAVQFKLTWEDAF